MTDELSGGSKPDSSNGGECLDEPLKSTVLDLGVPRGEHDSSLPPSYPPRTQRTRFGRWFLAAVFVLLAMGAIARLVTVERATRSPIDLTHMIEDGEFSASNVVGNAVPPHPAANEISWFAVRTLPAFTRSEDGVLEFQPDDSILTITAGLPIRRVNGVSIGDDRIDAFLTADANDRRRWITVGEGVERREIAFLRVMTDTQWARLLAGLSVGALGVLAFWLRPGTRSTVGFLIACLFVATLWYARAVPFYSRTLIEDLVYHVLQCYLSVPFVIFMASFTPLRLVVPRPWYAGMAAAVPSTALFAINLVLNPSATYHGYLVSPLFSLWALYMIVVILLTVPFGLWCRAFRIDLSPTDRARGRIVGLAVLLSFLPLIALTFIDYVGDSIATPKFLAEVGVVLFPVVITYAIVRHNLLRISELMREAVMYSFLSLGLLLLYVGITAAATAVLSTVREGYVQGLTIAGTLLIAFPSHTFARKLIARRLEVAPEAYDDILHRLDEIAKAAPSPDGYCREVVRLLGRIARTERVSILIREPGELDWKISDSQHGPRLTPVVLTCTPLIHELERSQSEIFLDDYLDELAQSNADETPLQSLQSLEANAVLPLSSRNQLIGAMALGSRIDHRNHSARELKLYKRVGNHIAGALVQMFDRIRTASGDRIVDIYPICPKRIGDYAIQRVVGEGGMSYVYLGENASGSAAIKVCNRYVQSDRKLLERFHREGVAMSRMKHPNIVPILDVGWEGPEPYIALEYFPRGSLEDAIRRDGPAPEATAMRYLRDAVRGLNAGLGHGIIHRDIKPTNLFITEKDVVKIGDFGLARLADRTTLTHEGEIFGTPHFMSPEILLGETADWTADQYALGVTLFFILTKRLPFEGEKKEALQYQHMNVPVPDVRTLQPELSEDCAELIKRMVAKQKDYRFGSYEQIERGAESILRQSG